MPAFLAGIFFVIFLLQTLKKITILRILRKNKYMTPEEKQLLTQLNWAREQVNVFISLEKQINIFFGDYGFENLIFFKPSMLGLLSTATLVNIISMELFANGFGYFFVLGAAFPALASFYVIDKAKALSKENIFKFLGEQKKLSPNLLSMIEMHVFSEQNKLLQIIEWRAIKKKMNEKDVQRYKRLFDMTSWQDPERARKHCTYIGVLMLSLQRYLYQNKAFYIKYIGSAKKNAEKIDSIYHVKNLPGAGSKSNTHSGNTSPGVDGINTEDFFDNTRFK